MILRRHCGQGVRSWALWSICGRYRYLLLHRWAAGPLPLYVLLNPSTAGEAADDATLARCRRRALAEGDPGLCVVNLFALCATDPRALADHPDPVGPANDAVLRARARRASRIVCGWGNAGRLNGRAEAVAGLLRQAGPPLVQLGLTARGEPRHPLYLPGERAAQPWVPALR